MSEVKNLKDMTDDDLYEEIEKEYGGIEGIAETDLSNPLVVEFFDRASRGRN